MVLTLYILQCADGSFYTGLTKDLTRRLAEHKDGFNISSYTYSRRPVNLVYVEQHSDPYYAARREKQVKGWSRRKKIAMIEGRWELLPELSKSRGRRT